MGWFLLLPHFGFCSALLKTQMHITLDCTSNPCEKEPRGPSGMWSGLALTIAGRGCASPLSRGKTNSQGSAALI